MKNYRYVAQGEFFVTTDPNTTLVTTGMTECMALAFIDRKNPQNRLLAHLDGQILSNYENTQKNLATLINAFTDMTRTTEFDVHVFGGQRKRRNYRMLLPEMEKARLEITKSLDIHEFCQLYNRTPRNKINLISACCTLICENSLEPVYTNYDASYFEPKMSEDDLSKGKALLSQEEKEAYEKFFEVNEHVLSSGLGAAQQFRTSADKLWVEEHAPPSKKLSI